MAKVLRRPGSALRLIKARELVVGDIVEVRVGDRVPADLRVCEIYSSVLMADQSILTGESLNVMKIGDPVKIPNPVNQDKINILFSGTNIVSGRAKCIVVSTGVSTEIGKIREHLSQTQTTKTPLQVKLDEFGNQLSFLITIICVLVWVINIHHFDDSFHGNSWIRGAIYYFKIAISLAVAAIPEGLPAVITTCLAIGTRRMAKKNAIVRNLRSVETLGCTSVICSDKTGTITTNQMAVQQLFFPKTNASQVQAIKVSGTTYDFRDGHVTDADVAPKELLEYITYTCCLCSDATISYDEQKKSIHRVGEATEASLLVFAEKLNVFGIDRSSMPISNQIRAVYDEVYKRFKKTFTLEFSRDRKSMSVYCEDRNNKGRYLLFVKGAYEEVISRCTHIYKSTKKVPFDPQDKTSFIQSLKSLCVGRDTLRCIGLAVVEDPEPLETIKKSKVHDFVKFENKMTFLGVCGMMDPPRVEVLDAIKNCANAGIRVIVITGDNKDTAEAICCRVGIFKDGQSTDGLSYSSREFDQLSRKDKLIACSRAQLFSRVEPKHKSEIVGCLQELGEITAMTGDGVNDAPALKKAEIGVAMGSGTAVAKSSADIVLSDDNFSSIIAAVFEGRAIFHNAVQFISYLISSNIGEVVCILVTSLMGLPECLIPVQLLWVNLITDGLPATALGFNPPPSDIMNHPPRDPKKPMIGTWQIIRYCAIGLYVGIVTIIGSLWWYMYDPTGPHLTFSHLMHHQHCGPNEPMYKGIDCQLFNNYIPMSISLSVLVFTEMFNACNSMSDSLSIFSFPPWRNGYLILAIFSSVIIHIGTLAFSATQTLFDVAMLAPHQWKVVMLLSFPVIILDEILKFGYRRVLRKKETLKVKNA
ncbi:Calcium-transporting ATPase sarcoplasmic/endoplasmic reticulum type [Thelohanellus kitauei]|uniref:Calcium-transporting ATPase n=1 Tax=Thelohanellus kitauei TaxID=669202 RepID=A0A0C2N1W8_THEKT|nr:Calcium-transporting ATPase sarcoplasmic/endoplasmic reticulum type [Thelohanellus kitauei]